MAISITVDNDRSTLALDPLLCDESSGVQTLLTTDDGHEVEITLDSNGLIVGFATPFNNFLNSAALGLSAARKAYARDHDGASSIANFVEVTTSADEKIEDLFFSDATGQALNGDTVTGMQTHDNLAVLLYTDGTYGSSGDFAVAATASGRIVAAFYLNEDTTTHESAQVQMVTFEPLKTTNTSNHDEPANFTDVLRVSAAGSLSFNFNALDSGANLWVAVGSASGGVLVSGKALGVDGATKITNASDKIHVSQGGEGTTIGENNQLFDIVGETAVFTLVTGMTVLSGDGGAQGVYLVDQKPQDNKPEGIDYSGYINVSGAGIFISQSQGNDLKDFDIIVTRAGGSSDPATQIVEDGVNYLGTGPSGAFNDDTPVNVKTVSVFGPGSSTVPIAVWSISPTTGQLASGDSIGAITVTINNNEIDLNGLDDLYTVQWTAVDGQTFNRFHLKHEAGQFDVGRVDLKQTIPSRAPIGDMLFVEDDGPSITGTLVGAPSPTVDESNLATNDSDSFAAQFSPTYGTDGQAATPVTYALSTPGGNSGLVDTASGQNVVLSLNGSGQVEGRTATSNLLVFVVSVNAAGSVSLDQQRAIIHTPNTGPDQSTTLANANLVVLTATAHDGDGDTAAAPLNIGTRLIFHDDGPSITATIVGAPSPTVDESNLATNDSDSFAAQFSPVYGADGQAATPVTYALSTPGGNSGLVDTASGQNVVLSLNGSGQVEGRTQTSNLLVFVVSVNASGSVSLDQQRAILHSPDTGPNQSATLANANLVVLTATAHDRDGDSASAPLNIGTQLIFHDDAPTIGPISDGIVDFLDNASVSKTLAGAVGADPKTNPYTLTSFTTTATAGEIQLQGIASGTAQVGYWADTNNDTIFGNAGDTEYYRLVLGDQGAAGNYTFTVLEPPPPSFTVFNFDALDSGANLWVAVGTAAGGVLVSGENLAVDGATKITNASDKIHVSQGGEGTTIGQNNQLFDIVGEAAVFTLVTGMTVLGGDGGAQGVYLVDQKPQDAKPEGIDYSGYINVNSAGIFISQSQGNDLKDFDIKVTRAGGSSNPATQVAEDGVNYLGTGPSGAFDDDAPVNVKTVSVFGPGSTDPIAVWSISPTTGQLASGTAHGVIRVTITDNEIDFDGLDDLYTVQWTSVDGQTFNRFQLKHEAGQFDVGKVILFQGNDTPDQKLDFTARVTDGDGDFASDSWSVGIDGTGVHDNGTVAGVSPASLLAATSFSDGGDIFSALREANFMTSEHTQVDYFL